ncbi:DUF736 domain-containing protein [Cupriavidus pauculus]|uniref:DUF736 domain-containing protein n=1 Tax=Cupriavidus pauculus TaxID=82633 RepID=A0A2N5C6P3_9BURK|nr:DUF736 domain-containing protein [Cupriavidus pauculus]PLP97901.1 DUF736 domain-containing protein [Cupriavidus pauculus]
MANIGTFTAQKNGFSGSIRTLTLDIKVKLIPNGKASDNAPDFRVEADGGLDIGGAWKRVSQSERPYLSVTVDDPALPAAIYARLIEDESGSYSLIWSRTRPAA